MAACGGFLSALNSKTSTSGNIELLAESPTGDRRNHERGGKIRQRDAVFGPAVSIVVSLAAFVVAGCTTSDNLKGPSIEFNVADVNRYADDQQKMLESFSNLAGLTPPIPLPQRGSPLWTDIAKAGINYSDLQCEKFIESIYLWHRRGETLKSELTLIGSTTTTILGLVKASQKEMAITAAAFGLVSGTLNNITSSFLFKVEPSRVRQTVEGLQVQYNAAVEKAQYTTRADAVATIAGYHAICLPANIEAELNQKIGGTGSEVAVISGSNKPPAVASPTDIAKASIVFSPDSNSDIIERVIFSDAARTVINVERANKMRDICYPRLSLPRNFQIDILLYSPEHEALRGRMVECLRSIGLV